MASRSLEGITSRPHVSSLREYSVSLNLIIIFFLKTLFALERLEDKAFPGVMNRRDTCRTKLASRTFYNPFAYNSNNAGSERLSANGKAFLEIPPLWDNLFLFSLSIIIIPKIFVKIKWGRFNRPIYRFIISRAYFQRQNILRRIALLFPAL